MCLFHWSLRSEMSPAECCPEHACSPTPTCWLPPPLCSPDGCWCISCSPQAHRLFCLRLRSFVWFLLATRFENHHCEVYSKEEMRKKRAEVTSWVQWSSIMRNLWNLNCLCWMLFTSVRNIGDDQLISFCTDHFSLLGLCHRLLLCVWLVFNVDFN